MQAQGSTATLINRYPNIFGILREMMAARHGPDLGGETLRILSFGCSTGAEVLSVRAYFPDAEILGCDINPQALSASVNALEADFAATFRSEPKAIGALGPYDIVMANAVLCSYPESARKTSLADDFPFSAFCDLAAPLLQAVKPGGAFILTNANYAFRDIPGADAFEPVVNPKIEGNGFVEKFDRHSKRVATTPVFLGQRHYAHRIEADAHAYTDGDFRHCLYVKGIAPQPDLGGAPAADMTLVLGGDPQAHARDGLTGAGLFRGVEDGGAVYEWRKAMLDGSVQSFGAWRVRSTVDAARENLVGQYRWTEKAKPQYRNWLNRLRGKFGA